MVERYVTVVEVESVTLSPNQTSFCKGDEITVTATLTGGVSLPDGCSIIWGGDGSFTSQSGLTATTTLDNVGENLVITAKVGTQSPAESSSFSVVQVDFLELVGIEPNAPNDEEGTDMFSLGATRELKAIPYPEISDLPPNYASWSIISKPEGSSLSSDLGESETLIVTPDVAGDYTVQAKCGDSTAIFFLIAVGPLEVLIDTHTIDNILYITVSEKHISWAF